MSNFDIAKKVSDTIDSIFEKVAEHDRMLMTDLITTIGMKTGIPVSISRAYAQAYLKDHPTLIIERGRDGGVFKGGRKIYVDKKERCQTCNQVLPRER